MAARTLANLSQQTKQQIFNRLNNGDSVDTVASEHGIKSSTLSRAWRRSKSKTRIKFEKIEKPISPNLDKPIITGKFTTNITGDMTLGSHPKERVLHLQANSAVRGLMFSDPHFPFHDVKAVDCFIRATKYLDYDILVNGGDTWDMYGLSRFGKDPKQMFAKHLQVEKTAWYDFNNNIARHVNVPKVSIFGNHMDRYMLWLYSNPSLTWLEEVQIDNVMKMEQYGWSPNVGMVMFNSDIENPDFPDPELIIHHGTLSRKHAGNSSKGESENFGYISSITGHVHRLGVNYKRTLKGIVLMAEAGTLRNLQPEYMVLPDWQHGFLQFTFIPGVGTFCEPILIIDGRAYINGKEI